MKIEKVKASVKAAIKRKSAYSLPNNPIEGGYKADDIRKAFYSPIIDDENSAISEIDRVINDINAAFDEMTESIGSVETELASIDTGEGV